MFTPFLSVFAALACYRITKNSFIIHQHELPFHLSLLLVFYHAFSKNEKCVSLLSDLRTISYNLKKLLIFAVFSPFSCRYKAFFGLPHRYFLQNSGKEVVNSINLPSRKKQRKAARVTCFEKRTDVPERVCACVFTGIFCPIG